MNDFQKFFRNKRILITGHTGFKGGWLSQILLGWGAKLSGIALRPNTRPNLFKTLSLERKIDNYFVDIRNFKRVKKIFQNIKPEMVFHLAAQPLVRDSYDNPLYTFETNIIGSANVLQAIKEVGGVRAAVMITTDKVYENKEDGRAYKENDKLAGYDPYSASKAGAEIIIDSYIKAFFNPKDYNKKHKTLIASARAGNVIGGGDWSKDRLASDIIKAIFEKNKEIIIRNPDSIRPWQHVLEPLCGYLLLAEKLYDGGKDFSSAWNFGPDKKNCLTVEELLKKALKIMGKGSYVIEKDGEKHEAVLLKLNSDKSKKFLRWRPKLNLDETFEETFSWYKNFYESKANIIDFTNRQIETFFAGV